ncbi:MAG: glycolate oxidase iron-sulfur subunit [endosymbiont of Galathealinum brachiosum]|uniref:Glycolate oxidase iron-sulfur subunit n=1 Tax=endosymbiont of Galathealinum brachiosum TaxID=2200906 RepID=A0A370D7Z2_9GAMM|nr:MAG: glycolate oxidase iron-sulfur subunit [endosymbiont of Galathealinum brachiosum]
MQTNLIHSLLETPQGQEADDILRSCVHCGFCTATCPTYQILGNELDSPRGRIYLIKQVLEGIPVTDKTRSHLDRCLTCRSCETTCPSGVNYGRLIDIGRELVEKQTTRKLSEQFSRYALRKIIPYPERFKFLLNLGNLFKPVLPAVLKDKIPAVETATEWPEVKHKRKMLILAGCVQQTTNAQTNASTANVLNKLGIELIQENEVKCCGAVSQHLSATDEAIVTIKKNIDAWWHHVNNGIEAIVITASGCGVMVKDYAHLLENDEMYALKAKRVSKLAKDISEIISNEDLQQDETYSTGITVAFHSPCTLQHGLQLNGVVEKILSNAGYKLTSVNDSHLCCGSAGTYSVLQPVISKKLLVNKITNLQKNRPDIIATANIGCQMHLSTKSDKPVKHWIELVESAIC